MDFLTDYRDWMRHSLKERSEHNPQYSLRAFARDLKLSPASISLVLNGKKGLSVAAADRISKRLNLTAQEQERFKTMVIAQHGRTPAVRKMAELKLSSLRLAKKVRTMQEDHFSIIANWYHFGILQLTYLKTFQPDVKWIAKQLNIPESDTREAIARLKRVKLIQVGSDGKFIVSPDYLLAEGAVPSEAIRKFHRQIIQKTLSAISEQPMEQRRFISTLIPIRQSEYDTIVKKMYSWNDEVANQHVAAPGEADSLYSISFQLIKINQETV